jgi:hypothetical protein
MSFYKGDLLNHFKRVEQVLSSLGAEASLNVRTFALEVRRGDARLALRPQFIAFYSGSKAYTPRFETAVTRFIGWCPYYNKRWELAADKISFKRFAVENGLRTPITREIHPSRCVTSSSSAALPPSARRSADPSVPRSASRS